MIIYINGASSSGKSTLANWIQDHSDKTLYYYSIDCLLETMPKHELELLRKFSKTEKIDWDSIWKGYFRSAAALSESGLDLILDCPLYDSRVEYYRQEIEPRNPRTIMLFCPVEELQKREIARGDRWTGLAKFQAAKVENTITHHFRFDTSNEHVDHMGKTILDSFRPEFLDNV